jgi:hypothetical protein
MVICTKYVLTLCYIKLLASTFKGQLATRHLLLVAASSPSEAHASSSGSGVSEWQRIAQKLQEVISHFCFAASACLIICLYRSGYFCMSS